MKLTIESIRTRAVAAPMQRPLATSTGALTAAALLLIDLQTDGGIVGRSYLFGIGKHNLPPIAKLVEAMAEMLKGDAVAPFDIERKLRAKYTLLGVHNIVLFAMSGIDMAAWDAAGQALGQPLARLLGATPRPIPAYNSKGLGIMPIQPLVKEAGELVEEGFEAALSRKQRARPAVPPIFDGEKEARLIALSCSKPPKGRARWTLRLLESAVVELNIVDRSSDSTIWRVLKKGSSGNRVGDFGGS